MREGGARAAGTLQSRQGEDDEDSYTHVSSAEGLKSSMASGMMRAALSCVRMAVLLAASRACSGGFGLVDWSVEWTWGRGNGTARSRVEAIGAKCNESN